MELRTLLFFGVAAAGSIGLVLANGVGVDFCNGAAENSSEPTSIPKRLAAFSQASTVTFG
jgi:hypothetical protein